MKTNWGWKSWGWPTVVVFGFIAMYEWAFHGVILKGMYMETASLWRPEAEMMNMVWIMWAAQLIFAGWMVWLFQKGYEGKGMWEGSRFGLWMAPVFAIMAFSWWAILPIPAALAWAWLIGTAIECIGAGTVLGWAWKPAK